MSASDHSPRSQDPPPPFDEVMRALIAMCWRDLWKAMPSRKDLTDPEAVHEVRVASRRLRAAMDIGGDAGATRWYRRLHREAKRITQAFGALRDADVMLAALRAERESAPESDILGLDELIDRQEAIRTTALAEARRSLKQLKQRHIRQESRKRFPRPSRKRRATVRRALAAKGGF